MLWHIRKGLGCPHIPGYPSSLGMTHQGLPTLNLRFFLLPLTWNGVGGGFEAKFLPFSSDTSGSDGLEGSASRLAMNLASLGSKKRLKTFENVFWLEKRFERLGLA